MRLQQKNISIIDEKLGIILHEENAHGNESKQISVRGKNFDKLLQTAETLNQSRN